MTEIKTGDRVLFQPWYGGGFRVYEVLVVHEKTVEVALADGFGPEVKWAKKHQLYQFDASLWDYIQTKTDEIRESQKELYALQAKLKPVFPNVPGEK